MSTRKRLFLDKIELIVPRINLIALISGYAAPDGTLGLRDTQESVRTDVCGAPEKGEWGLRRDQRAGVTHESPADAPLKPDSFNQKCQNQWIESDGIKESYLLCLLLLETSNLLLWTYTKKNTMKQLLLRPSLGGTILDFKDSVTLATNSITNAEDLGLIQMMSRQVK